MKIAEIINKKWGKYDLKVRVSGSTKAGAVKGVTQILGNVNDKTEYTIIAWVRSDGVSNGVGRVLVNYSSQLELYRSSDVHGWKLYTGKITTSVSDVVSVNCEILTTAANTDGTVYFDGLMFIEGDWVTEAENGVLPYISGADIYNRTDVLPGTITAGAINYVDVWNVPGDVDGLTRLEIINNTGGATPPKFERIIVGQRRLGDVFNLENYSDLVGTADATGTSQTSKSISALNSSWQQEHIDLIIGAVTTKDNIGRYRLFARVYDSKATAPFLQARTRYFKGTSGVNDKILDASRVQVGQTWTTVNLTENAAVNFDNKFQTAYPNQMGYSVEMKRDDGSVTGAKLDYTILMPTDGGFIEANFNPSLGYGSGLLIDNTNSVSISSYQKRRSYWVPFFTDGYAPAGFYLSQYTVIYKDYLYMSTGQSPATEVRVIKYKPGETTMVSVQVNTGGTSSLAGYKKIYKDYLYVANEAGFLYKFDPVSLSYLGSFTTFGGFYIMGIEVCGDYLYIWENIFPATSRLVRFDGTNEVVVANYGTSAVALLYNPLREYNGYLFMGNSAGVFRYDPSTNNTVNTGGLYAKSFEVWNDALYATDNSTGTYIYNGTGWSLITAKTGSNLISYNNRLYLSSTTNLYYTENGTDWIEDIGLSGQVANNVYQNLLIGIPSFGGLTAYYAVSVDAQEFGVSDYKGSMFYSPSRTQDNEKRHRYYFLADRDNFENNINDKMLVGVGFVPRYLSLVNYYPQ